MPESLWDRLWRYVDAEGDCWIWTAGTSAGGYGMIRSAGRTQYTHRLAWELLVGPILPGLVIDHLCKVKRCVNPDHLEPVTTAENSRRNGRSVMARRSLWAECPRGHALAPAGEKRQRTCGVCDAARQRIRRQRALADRAPLEVDGPTSRPYIEAGSP